MKFEEVLPALREGKKIRRKDRVWQNNYGFLLISETENKIFSDNAWESDYKITKDDLNADDWEIVKEKKKVKLRDISEEQYNGRHLKYCRKANCDDCFLNIVQCDNDEPNCRLFHKDMFSDKFLDQEIEVEE